MPHTFNPHPDHPAVDYLVRLHADIGGRIKDNKSQALQLAIDMRAVEAVLKMFDPEYNCRAISARRRVPTNPWFKRGTLFRHAVDVLRKATEPMTVPAIAEVVMAKHGIKDATKDQTLGIIAGIRSSLERNAGQTVERVGDGVPRRWRLVA